MEGFSGPGKFNATANNKLVHRGRDESKFVQKNGVFCPCLAGNSWLSNDPVFNCIPFGGQSERLRWEFFFFFSSITVKQ